MQIHRQPAIGVGVRVGKVIAGVDLERFRFLGRDSNLRITNRTDHDLRRTVDGCLRFGIDQDSTAGKGVNQLNVGVVHPLVLRDRWEVGE